MGKRETKNEQGEGEEEKEGHGMYALQVSVSHSERNASLLFVKIIDGFQFCIRYYHSVEWNRCVSLRSLSGVFVNKYRVLCPRLINCSRAKVGR